MRKEERLLSEICDSAISKLEGIKKISEMVSREKRFKERYLNNLKPLVSKISESKKPYISQMQLSDFEAIKQICNARHIVFGNLADEKYNECVATVAAHGADLVCLFIPADTKTETLPKYFDEIDKDYIPHHTEIVEWYENHNVYGYVLIVPFVYLYDEIEKADKFLAMVARQVFGKDTVISSDDIRKRLM